MPGDPTEPQAVQLSVAVYRSLVKAYPQDFRRDYGDAMVQVFRDACRHASSGSDRLGLLSFWGRTLIDYFKSIIEENVKGGTHMTRDKFYKLSGWALILSPILFVIGFWATSRQEYPVLPIDRFADAAGMLLAVVGLLFGSLGLIGLIGRFTPGWNTASILLGLSALAGVGSTIGAGLLNVVENGMWNLFMGGILVQYLLLGVFGILNLRRKIFPRWNGLPVLAFWLVIALVMASGLIPVNIPESVFAAGWLLTCVMFIGLGYQLQSTSQTAAFATA